MKHWSFKALKPQNCKDPPYFFLTKKKKKKKKNDNFLIIPCHMIVVVYYGFHIGCLCVHPSIFLFPDNNLSKC